MTKIPMAAVGTVLVADDDEANRRLVAEMLRRDGYPVVLARDGEEASAMFATVKVDLAILDVLMPTPNGFEVCRAIKENAATRLIPVVLIAGLSGAIASCINNAIIEAEELDPYAQTEGERRSS